MPYKGDKQVLYHEFSSYQKSGDSVKSNCKTRILSQSNYIVNAFFICKETTNNKQVLLKITLVLFLEVVYHMHSDAIIIYNSEVANAVDVAASSAGSSDEFKKAYNTGKSKGIITDENMSYKDFVSLCKKYVFPAYLNAVKEDSTLTFQSFIAQDNYEVSPEDSGVTSSALLRATDSSSYNMQAGDILVVWGSNSLDKASYVGHAAIASSSKYIMEMPGKKISKHATHTKKATFFKRHTGGPRYVEVYRIKNTPNMRIRLLFMHIVTCTLKTIQVI